MECCKYGTRVIVKLKVKKSFKVENLFFLLSLSRLSFRCHGTQHDDTQHNDTQYYDTQHNDTQHDTQFEKCYFADLILSVIMVSVVGLVFQR